MPGFNIAGTRTNDFSMGTNTLADVGDAHRNHRWRIDALPVNDPTASKNIGYLLPYAKSVTLPDVEFDEVPMEGSSLIYKFAGRPKFSDATIEFYDVYGLYDELHAAQRRIWNPNDGLSVGSQYKARTQIVLTSGGGGNIVEYVLINSWIKKVSHSPLSYDNSEFKLLILTISCDWVEAEFSNEQFSN